LIKGGKVMFFTFLAMIFFALGVKAFGFTSQELGYVLAFVIGCGIISEGMRK